MKGLAGCGAGEAATKVAKAAQASARLMGRITARYGKREHALVDAAPDCRRRRAYPWRSPRDQHRYRPPRHLSLEEYDRRKAHNRRTTRARPVAVRRPSPRPLALILGGQCPPARAQA